MHVAVVQHQPLTNGEQLSPQQSISIVGIDVVTGQETIFGKCVCRCHHGRIDAGAQIGRVKAELLAIVTDGAGHAVFLKRGLHDMSSSSKR